MPQTNRKVFRISLLSSFQSLLFAAVLSLLFASHVSAQDAAAGEKIYKQYCTSCHKINGDLVGPALKDVHKRRTEPWLIQWIHNNQKLRAAGDKDALAIWQKFNKSEMPAFTNLSDGDIKSIIAYVQRESEAPAVQANAPGGTGDQNVAGGEGGTGYRSVLWVILVVFVLLVFLLSRINSNLRRLLEARLGEPVTAPFSWNNWLRQKTTIATLLLIAITYLGYAMTQGAQKLGRSKGYQPEQPIKFSHAVHAGVNQINCLYCHVGADKGKHAVIPSGNICMNCHKGVQEGRTPAGTAELQKVIAAYKEERPIQWVKIHNLPDHVYFNHAQHVAIGKVECQTCHGPVQEMDEVYQFASLSMGWCINCHRNTKVQFAQNDYYKQFEQLHEDLRSGKITTVTEETMGGTECQKCHY